jgi:hypothetical protein
MKKQCVSLRIGSVLMILFLFTTVVGIRAQSTVDAEVPGDNFSLEGALELFKKSSSPEEFEKLLNSPDSKVNNLDLNGDGNIDYIRVIDRNEGNVHAFIIQAVISDSERQDVAVIELEKLSDGKAVLQITGDADVYGMETIIEPTEEVRVNAGTTTARTVVNVWTWPSVQYVYGPTYAVWVSPWSWAYHPFWWHPWRPVAYYVYDPWWRPYRPYYSVCYSHRIGYLPIIYHPYRRTSVVVYHNHRHQIDGYRFRYSGSRSDRYNSDRYSSNGRSRGGNGRSDGYSSGRTRNENTSNFVRTRSSRSSEINRNLDRQRTVNRDLNNVNRDRQTSGRSIERSQNQTSDRTFERSSRDISNTRETNNNRDRIERTPRTEQRQNRLENNNGNRERSNEGSSMRQTREPASNMRTINRSESRSSGSPSVGRSSNSRPSISNGGGGRSGGGNKGGGGRSSGRSRN